MENNDFIRVHIKKYGDMVDQLKDYEQSLLKIYHYATFRENPVELILDELNEVLGKY